MLPWQLCWAVWEKMLTGPFRQGLGPRTFFSRSGVPPTQGGPYHPPSGGMGPTFWGHFWGQHFFSTLDPKKSQNTQDPWGCPPEGAWSGRPPPRKV